MHENDQLLIWPDLRHTRPCPCPCIYVQVHSLHDAVRTIAGNYERLKEQRNDLAAQIQHTVNQSRIESTGRATTRSSQRKETRRREKQARCYTAQRPLRTEGQLMPVGGLLSRSTTPRPSVNSSQGWVLWGQSDRPGIEINKQAFVAERPGATVTFTVYASTRSNLVIFAVRSSTYAGGSAELILDGTHTGNRVDAYWNVMETSVQPFRFPSVLEVGRHNVGFRVLGSTLSPRNVTLFAVTAIALLPVVKSSPAPKVGAIGCWGGFKAHLAAYKFAYYAIITVLLAICLTFVYNTQYDSRLHL